MGARGASGAYPACLFLIYNISLTFFFLFLPASADGIPEERAANRIFEKGIGLLARVKSSLWYLDFVWRRRNRCLGRIRRVL